MSTFIAYASLLVTIGFSIYLIYKLKQFTDKKIQH